MSLLVWLLILIFQILGPIILLQVGYQQNQIQNPIVWLIQHRHSNQGKILYTYLLMILEDNNENWDQVENSKVKTFLWSGDEKWNPAVVPHHQHLNFEIENSLCQLKGNLVWSQTICLPQLPCCHRCYLKAFWWPCGKKIEIQMWAGNSLNLCPESRSQEKLPLHSSRYVHTRYGIASTNICIKSKHHFPPGVLK